MCPQLFQISMTFYELVVVDLKSILTSSMTRFFRLSYISMEHNNIGEEDPSDYTLYNPLTENQYYTSTQLVSIQVSSDQEKAGILKNETSSLFQRENQRSFFSIFLFQIYSDTKAIRGMKVSYRFKYSNKFVLPLQFKMLSTLQYKISVQRCLKSSKPTNSQSFSVLCFGGKVFQFRVLPFGLPSFLEISLILWTTIKFSGHQQFQAKSISGLYKISVHVPSRHITGEKFKGTDKPSQCEPTENIQEQECPHVSSIPVNLFLHQKKRFLHTLVRDADDRLCPWDVGTDALE